MRLSQAHLLILVLYIPHLVITLVIYYQGDKNNDSKNIECVFQELSYEIYSRYIFTYINKYL